jgi:hypothetical protein
VRILLRDRRSRQVPLRLSKMVAMGVLVAIFPTNVRAVGLVLSCATVVELKTRGEVGESGVPSTKLFALRLPFLSAHSTCDVVLI